MAQVEVRIDGHLMCVTVNRHEARNALSAQMCDDITSALNNADEQARDTAAIRAVLIRSVGTTFCAASSLWAVPPKVMMRLR
ncbi:enoyl-CoA hydratase [Corynebacterium diphtheriae]|nr:enoyl-CoA hydratase-related protein [Corynebacterium diphtheriae]CAB0639281.1 enoyl-CoA hydratase [Corynebacterium diphtheriae]